MIVLPDHLSIEAMVGQSLVEDIGAGDITAELIPADMTATAQVISRESAVIAGRPWFEAVYRQLDPGLACQWHVPEGERVATNAAIVTIEGNARSVLTGERAALNWLQTLSAVATQTAEMVELLSGSNTQLLDTRKTIPGLRAAQKYAVRVGGGQNHRLGLFDAYLIKENHIACCGSIAAAIQRARELNPGILVEVEVENLAELDQAVQTHVKADVVMLDNFSLEDISTAVARVAGQVKLEVSGNVSKARLRDLAKTGVDYISMGALTKNISAIDLSMRVICH